MMRYLLVTVIIWQKWLTPVPSPTHVRVKLDPSSPWNPV